MRIVIQRVKRASVSVEEKVVGSIQKGFLVLIGVGQGDDEATADKYMKKLLGLRIFEDENGKTNCSLKDVDGTTFENAFNMLKFVISSLCSQLSLIHI